MSLAKRTKPLFLVMGLVILALAVPAYLRASASTTAVTTCVTPAQTHVGKRGRDYGVYMDSTCTDTAGDSSGMVPTTQSPTRVVDCGIAVAGHDDRWNVAQCGTHYQACADAITHGSEDAFATQTQNPASNRWTTTTIWCPQTTTPTPNPDTLRQHAIRLLPALAPTINPPDNGLVNLENILSNPTSTRRTLPAANVLGTTVRLRLHFDHATWTYGDKSDPDTTHDPGQSYDQAANPCHTLQCPDYFGHTYTQPGTYTISTTITWTVDYTLNNRDWATLGPLNGPTTRHTTHIRSAHTQLVP